MSSANNKGSSSGSSPPGKDKDKKKLTARSAALTSNDFSKVISAFVFKHLRTIAQVFFATVVVIVGYILYKSLFTGVRDLRNSDAETLKELLLGEDPAVYYCHR